MTAIIIIGLVTNFFCWAYIVKLSLNRKENRIPGIIPIIGIIATICVFELIRYMLIIKQ